MEVFEVFRSISDAINQIKGKDILGVSSALVALIRLYRMVPKAPWVPQGKEWAVQLGLFWVGYVVSALTGALGFNMTWEQAFAGALAVAVNASGIHVVTKSAGQSLRQNESKEKGWFSKLLDVVLPHK